MRVASYYVVWYGVLLSSVTKNQRPSDLVLNL